jgi:hypothetical protein
VKSFPHNIHRFSTAKNGFIVCVDVCFVIFSTNSRPPYFFHYYMWITISLTFIIFCLDNGVHFNTAKTLVPGAVKKTGNVYLTWEHFKTIIDNGL